METDGACNKFWCVQYLSSEHLNLILWVVLNPSSLLEKLHKVDAVLAIISKCISATKSSSLEIHFIKDNTQQFSLETTKKRIIFETFHFSQLSHLGGPFLPLPLQYLKDVLVFVLEKKNM